MPALMRDRKLGEAPFVIVLAVVLASVLVAMAAPQHWLRAVGVLSFALALAGAFRFLLSDEQAGLLKIRTKAFDVPCYWLFAFCVGLFGLVSPGR